MTILSIERELSAGINLEDVVTELDNWYGQKVTKNSSK